MSRLAGLINKEKNRRVVSSMFSSDATAVLPCSEPLADNPLSEPLIVLERAIFEDGVMIDESRSKLLISELEAIASTLSE